MNIVYVPVCVCVHTYTHTHIYTYTHTYIHTYINTYIHTRININPRLLFHFLHAHYLELPWTIQVIRSLIPQNVLRPSLSHILIPHKTPKHCAHHLHQVALLPSHSAFACRMLSNVMSSTHRHTTTQHYEHLSSVSTSCLCMLVPYTYSTRG
jgi:hypothetical protein